MKKQNIKRNTANMLKIAILSFSLAAVPAGSAVCAAATQASSPADTAGTMENSQSLKLSTKTYKKDFKTKKGQVYKTISYEYPVASGSSDAANTFNQFYTDMRSKWLKSAKKDLADAKALVLQFPSDSSRYYSDEVTCKITTGGTDYISIMQSGYTYTMGAHGMPYRITRIFDAKTGMEASAASMLGITPEDLNSKVQELYIKKYNKTLNTDRFQFYPGLKELEAALLKVDFNENLYYMKNGRLYFYVEPYILGPYASGYIETSIKL